MTAEPKLMSADELADIELDLFAPGPGRLQIRQLLAHIAAQEQRIADLEFRLHIATETNVADRRLLKTASDQADEFAAENSRLRVELGEAKLVIEQQDKDADRLRTALTDACACWRNPCLTAREKERHIEILAMLDE